MNSVEVEQEFAGRYQTLEAIAAKLQLHLKGIVAGTPRVDSVSARAKGIARFVAKAMKLNEDGSRKYQDPLIQIQDQVGARITVFYLSDVATVRETIGKYFRYIEAQDKVPPKDEEFGYFGLHFIVRIPDDVLPDDQINCPDFFELQVKTLFQHAWSEAHHDLGYKSERPLTSEEKRKLAFTAAQAWGADTIFEELSAILSTNDNERR